jgi:hypothetical protein
MSSQNIQRIALTRSNVPSDRLQVSVICLAGAAFP